MLSFQPGQVHIEHAINLPIYHITFTVRFADLIPTIPLDNEADRKKND